MSILHKGLKHMHTNVCDESFPGITRIHHAYVHTQSDRFVAIEALEFIV